MRKVCRAGNYKNLNLFSDVKEILWNFIGGHPGYTRALLDAMRKVEVGKPEIPNPHLVLSDSSYDEELGWILVMAAGALHTPITRAQTCGFPLNSTRRRREYSNGDLTC